MKITMVRWKNIVIAFCLLHFLSPSYADNVILKNGNVIECRILKESEIELIVNSSGAVLTLKKSIIDIIKRADEAENAILSGDELVKKGELEQAVKVYQRALEKKPEIVKQKIALVEKMITEKTEQQKENLSLEEKEKQLKQELAKENFPPEKVATVKMQLTEVLIKRAKTEMIYMNQSKCTQLLEEAWNLSPQMPEVVIPLARSLLGLHKEEQAELILKAYVKYNPDDMEALKLYVRAVYKKNPWDALKLCYPNKQPHPKTTESLLIFIPDVLLACFNARSEPPDDAPFDRIGCYERLIEMKRETSPLPILQHKVKMNPNSAGELIALAKYYYGQQEYFEAVAILQKSIDIKPTIEAKELLQQAIRNRGVDIYTFCQAIVDGDVLKYKGYIVKGTGPCVRSGSMSSKSMYQSYDVVIPCAKSRTRGIFLVSSISAALDIVYGKDLIPIVLGDSSGYSGSRVNFSGRFEGEFQYVYIEIKGRKRLSSLAPESESHAPLRKRQRQVQPLVEPFIDDDISKSVPVLVNCTVSSY